MHGPPTPTAASRRSSAPFPTASPTSCASSRAPTGTFQCDDAKGGKAETIGFIAQEVEQVIPEAVQKLADPANQLYGMDYEKLIPVLVKATQELKTENDTLKAQLLAMQQRLEKLERAPGRQ